MNYGTNESVNDETNNDKELQKQHHTATSSPLPPQPHSLLPRTPPPPTTTTQCSLPLVLCGKEQLFLWAVVASVAFAWVDPSVATLYLAPAITAQWLAVMIIFVCTGLHLSAAESRDSIVRHAAFHAFVQTFNFFIVSALVYGGTRVLIFQLHWLRLDLGNGMVVCACLPMAINLVVVLSQKANGDEAAAVFNATLSNFIGIFVSPLLIPFYVGVSSSTTTTTTDPQQQSIVYSSVLASLTAKVLLPVFVGQVLQQRVPAIRRTVQHHKRVFKIIPQCCLIFIIYTVFCQTFLDSQTQNITAAAAASMAPLNSSDHIHSKSKSTTTATTTTTMPPLTATAQEVGLMILFQFLFMVSLMLLAWTLLRRFFPDEPKLRVMGLFGCTHKTISIGVPLIAAIYHDNNNTNPGLVGMVTLPLLIWNPMQLLLGSILAPFLRDFVSREQERLGIRNNDDTEEEGGNDAATAAAIHKHALSSVSEVNENDPLL